MTCSPAETRHPTRATRPEATRQAVQVDRRRAPAPGRAGTARRETARATHTTQPVRSTARA